MAKVYVVIPNIGSMRPELALQLLEMARDSRHTVEVHTPQEVPTDSNRNRSINEFLATDCEWYLTIDSDNPPMRNPLDLIDLDKDIMGCPTPTWAANKERLIKGSECVLWNGYLWDPKQGDHGAWLENVHREGLRQVDALGSGCLLIARRVLEKMTPPWFVREWEEDGTVRFGSDLVFTHTAKTVYGFGVWAHYDYPCHHYAEIDLLTLQHYRYVRDISHALKPNINTPEYWDGEWSKRPPRAYSFDQRIMQLCEGRTVLDFGCGRGDLLAKLKDVAKMVCGVDLSFKAVEICEARGLHAFQGDDPSEVRPDDVGLPSQDSWDVCLCTEVLEHLDDDVEAMESLLNGSNGRALYTVPANTLPPGVEPEHRRVYTLEYINRVTPDLRKIEIWDDYFLVIFGKGWSREEIE